ncbi:TetR/AcrR family transcriptional regulator [Solimonas sp. K1W22B-7]|uniref:TetR/AcrR family transcriptional regulator n=1 Tax=Solimonas sp. K1W22B-7 TaxID=2303331 RepID=UPI0013C40FB1|nr:TetR/AcrR family transcriptional regulator [Solimonas sp. K1W22B-7]
MRLFWSNGFSATSLDDLVSVTGLNRPSLYNAFGNKLSIYRRAFARFAEKMRSDAGAALMGGDSIQDALLAFYSQIIRVYMEDPEAPGCLVFCTAPAEASRHPEIRSDLSGLIQGLDGFLEARIESARKAGQLPEGTSSRALASIAQGLLHSLAVRARAGDTEAHLRKFARDSVAAIFGNKVGPAKVTS